MLAEVNFECVNCGRNVYGAIDLGEEVDSPQYCFPTCECGEDHEVTPRTPTYMDGKLTIRVNIEGDGRGKTTDQIRDELILEYKDSLGQQFYDMSATDIRVGFADWTDAAKTDGRMSEQQYKEMEGWEGWEG